MRRSTNHRGFMATDMIFGMIILSAVAIALAATSARVRSADTSLAETRRAVHLAEHALLNLQHGQPMPVTAGDVHLTIQPLSSGSAPSGFVWAKVDATVHGHRQSLIGVIPAGSISTSGGK
jgi:hypothetical protein